VHNRGAQAVARLFAIVVGHHGFQADSAAAGAAGKQAGNHGQAEQIFHPRHAPIGAAIRLRIILDQAIQERRQTSLPLRAFILVQVRAATWPAPCRPR